MTQFWLRSARQQVSSMAVEQITDLASQVMKRNLYRHRHLLHLHSIHKMLPFQYMYACNKRGKLLSRAARRGGPTMYEGMKPQLPDTHYCAFRLMSPFTAVMVRVARGAFPTSSCAVEPGDDC